MIEFRFHLIVILKQCKLFIQHHDNDCSAVSQNVGRTKINLVTSNSVYSKFVWRMENILKDYLSKPSQLYSIASLCLISGFKKVGRSVLCKTYSFQCTNFYLLSIHHLKPRMSICCCHVSQIETCPCAVQQIGELITN